VTKIAPQLDELEKKTVEFVKAFVDSDLPPVIKEAALFNASTLRTQTSFRAEDGRFYGWEGCNDYDGCCTGSCTHVWNYEQATPFLYGSLSRSMREVEFGHATQKNGYMSFRVNLPLVHAQEQKPAAADGQMGTIMKLYRDWRLSGDDKMLKTLWPYAKTALQFAWIPGGWDADHDGVMEGCQHNTMDIEYYGPNPEVGVWYLGALRAGEEMAKTIGDEAFAKVCRDLFQRGSSWLDANLFNGEYYEQHIVPAADEKSIAEGLRLGAGAKDLEHPELQLGAGCLTDQLVGQYMAHVAGLGYLLAQGNVRTTLASIVKYNYCDDLSGHFNHLRTYALGEEAGTIIATYPKGRRPKRPFPYAFEVWTGLEYTAAAGMLYEGLDDDALKIVAAVRDRHEGFKRNPFDEPECGHHYARAMASWGLILAATGFHYDGVDGRITFKASPKSTTWFWSSGDAWGTFQQSKQRNATQAKLNVLGGSINVKTLTLTGGGTHGLDATRALKAGESLEATITA
jgi:non-lysosomal glucosylceramidase